MLFCNILINIDYHYRPSSYFIFFIFSYHHDHQMFAFFIFITSVHPPVIYRSYILRHHCRAVNMQPQLTMWPWVIPRYRCVKETWLNCLRLAVPVGGMCEYQVNVTILYLYSSDMLTLFIKIVVEYFQNIFFILFFIFFI